MHSFNKDTTATTESQACRRFHSISFQGCFISPSSISHFCLFNNMLLTPLFFSLPPSLPFSLSQPLCSLFSNKSHLIVHFLSWPGAWCQTSCMKCSSTALPASTFVQRKNNKKKIPQSLLNSAKLFFSPFPFEEEAKQLLIHCLFYCHVPLKGYSNHLILLHEETLYFFLMTETVAFVSGF